MSNKLEKQNYKIKEVQFNGVTLIGVQNESGRIFVAFKKICEDLGLNASKQLSKVKRDETLNEGVYHMGLPSAGGIQDTFCLDIEYLPLYLAGIQSSKCKSEVRANLKEFKLKAKDILASAFLPEIKKEPETKLKEFSLEEALKIAYENEKAKNQLLEHNQKLERKLVRTQADSDILMNSYKKYKDQLFDMTQVSAELNIKEMGLRNLFKFLREQDVFYRSGEGINFAKQKYKNNGCFVHKLSPFTDQEGRARANTKILATVKGLYLISRLLHKHGYIDISALQEVKDRYIGKGQMSLSLSIDKELKRISESIEV